MANIDKEKLNELLNGDINEFIEKNLSAEQTAKLNAILNDKDSANELLSSPQAKELFKKLFNDK